MNGGFGNDESANYTVSSFQDDVEKAKTLVRNLARSRQWPDVVLTCQNALGDGWSLADDDICFFTEHVARALFETDHLVESIAAATKVLAIMVSINALSVRMRAYYRLNQKTEALADSTLVIALSTEGPQRQVLEQYRSDRLLA